MAKGMIYSTSLTTLFVIWQSSIWGTRGPQNLYRQGKVQSSKKDKSPKKVLLKMSEVPDLDMPAYVGRGLEPIQEDMEHFAVISPPPGLDKRDDEFSDSLWSRSTTGGSGSAFESPDEDEEPTKSFADQFAMLSSLQYQESAYHMIAASLLQSTKGPPQAQQECATTWAQPAVRNFCPWCGCKRATYYTFCPNCGNKLDE